MTYGSDATGRSGVHAVAYVIENNVGWIFREQPVSDFGIDGQIEPRDPQTHRGTGRLVGCQIKSGKSYLSEPTHSGFIYRGKPEHLAYWLGHSLPVLLILHDADANRCYWQVVNEQTVTRTGKSWKIEVPRSQVLGEDAKGYLEKLADTGWIESTKTFTSLKTSFPVSDHKSLFDYDQSLQGRTASLAELNSFLADESKAVGVLTGRGGIGKTKLVRHWVSGIRGWKVLYRKERVPIHAGSENELSGTVLIIADDAHRQSDVDSLLQLVRDKKREGMIIKILLSCRPIGNDRINAALARSFDPAEVARFKELQQLSEGEVRELAQEVLGSAHSNLVPFLVSVSEDTPLVTVIGGRLLARGSVNPASLAGSEEFKAAVFDKFLDDYEEAPHHRYGDVRPLLQLIAAIQPIPMRSEEFARDAAAFVNYHEFEVWQAIDSLESCGLLYRAANTYRIAPDMFADFLLEQACVTKAGESTKYGDAVFAAFGTRYLSNLLQNLAELDFRLVERGRTSLLNEVWNNVGLRFRAADIGSKAGLLKSLQAAAFYQPAAVLVLVRTALQLQGVESNALSGSVESGIRDVLEELPPLLRAIAYHPLFTQEAVQILWRLAKSDCRTPRTYPDHAVRVMKQLASYSRYKPVTFNLKMAEISAGLKNEPDSFAREFTPLDIVDTLLEREGEENESTGMTITLISFGLNYPVVKPVRDICFRAIEQCLFDSNATKGCRALQSLSHLLYGYLPKFGRQQTEEERRWQSSERYEALGIISRRVAKGSVPLELAREIKNTLVDFHFRTANEDHGQEIEEILTHVSKTPLIDIFDSFCRADWDWRSAPTSDEEITSARSQVQQECMEAAFAFATLFPDVPGRIDKLAEFYRRAEQARIKADGALAFVGHLCADREFLLVLAHQIAEDSQDKHLSVTTQVVLSKLRESQDTSYIKLGLAAARSKDIVVVRSAAAALWGLDFTARYREDLQILDELSRNDDLRVRRLVLTALSLLGRSPKAESDCKDRILAFDIGDDPKFADDLCDCFTYHRIEPSHLTESQLDKLIDKLVPVPDLDEHGIGSVLGWMAKERPATFTKLLTARIERARTERIAHNWRYRIFPHQSRNVHIRGTFKTSDSVNLIEVIWQEYQKEKESDEHELMSLFWEIVTLDEPIVDFFERRIGCSDPEAATLAIKLLSYGPPRLAFTHPELVAQCLDKAATIRREVLEDVRSWFITNCHPLNQLNITGRNPNSLREEADSLLQKAGIQPSLKELYRAIRDVSVSRALGRFVDDDDLHFEAGY